MEKKLMVSYVATKNKAIAIYTIHVHVHVYTYFLGSSDTNCCVCRALILNTWDFYVSSISIISYVHI